MNQNPNTNEFFIIGSPLNKESITQEFIDFINSNEETIILLSCTPDSNKYTVSQEYKSGKIGFDMIADAGYEFISYKNMDIKTFGDYKKIAINFDTVWYDTNTGVRTQPYDVAKILLCEMIKINQIYKNKRIARVSPGSPYLYDGVADYLLKYCPLVKVINSKSSAQLSYEALNLNNLTEGLPMRIVDKNFKYILKSNFVNIIGSVGYVYQNYEYLMKVASDISGGDLIYKIGLGEKTTIEKITTQDFSKFFIRTPDYKPITLAIIKK